MNGSPSVAIVISNHDYGRFVQDAIDSALEQSHHPTQVVVVDDGSTDDSRERIESYGDRVTAIFKAQGGQSTAINAGVEVCDDADLVIFLDADDMLEASTCASVVAALQRQPDLAKVHYRLAVIDGSGLPTGEVRPPAHLRLPSGDLRDAELRSPFDLPWTSMSGAAFPRWVLHRLLPVPDRFRSFPDWYLQHLATLLGPVGSLVEVGGRYRVHGGNGHAIVDSRLDLDQVRRTTSYAAATRLELSRLADQLDLAHPNEILSVADIAHRLVSRRLEPMHHPVTDDTVAGLVWRGWRASVRRRDVSVAHRMTSVAWFALGGVLPRRWFVSWAEWLLFPGRRAFLGALLARQQRSRGDAP